MKARRMGWLLAALALGLVVWQRGKTGRFLAIPYDFRLPTPQRIRDRLWNPEDERLFTPRVFGWGWAINFHAAARKLGLIK